MVKARGDHHFSKKDYDLAMKEYEQALIIDPHNEYAISNIGLIHMKQGEYDKCFEWTSRALEVLSLFNSDTLPF